MRAAGLPCEVALRTGLEDRQNPRLTVLGVEVNGDQALARVRSTAGGEPPSTDLVRLVKEDGELARRVAVGARRDAADAVADRSALGRAT